MMKKAIAILLSFLMIFQMLPMAAIAEGLQEDTGMLQPAESNDIEGVDVEEVFEVNFALDDEADQEQDPGQKRFFFAKSNNGKGPQGKSQGRGAEKRVRRHGEKVGKLPDAPNKKHLYGWVDKKSKRYVTENTLVTGSMTLSPVGMNEENLSLSAGGVSVEVPAESVPENTEFSAVSVSPDSVVAALEGLIDEAGEIRAVDLTFTDTNIDQEVEPAKAVTVSMSVAGMDTSDLAVIHIKDDGSKEMVPFTLNGEIVIFSAVSFSVYIVVEDIVPRLTVEFKTYDGENTIGSMIIKAADTEDEVATIIYDPGAGALDEGMIFKGWTTVQEYDNDTELLTIDQVRTDAMTTVDSMSEDDTVTYYAAVFKAYTITYLSDDDSPITVGMATASYPAYEEEDNEVEVVYPVNMGYTVDDKHNFEGWVPSNDTQSHIKSYPTGATAENVTIDGQTTTVYYYPNDTEITITGDVTFVVRAPEGSWLVFDETCEDAVRGATYTAPQFVLAGDVTKVPSTINSMACFGYTFGGWYDTAAHALAHAEDPENVTDGAFEFGHVLPEGITIYASWIPNTTANYTILIWKEKLNPTGDDRYDFAASCVGTGNVGDSIQETAITTGTIGALSYVTINGTQYGGIKSVAHTATTDPFTGFTVSQTNGIEDATITPEGDAVANVFFDRMTYTLKFYVTRTNRNGNGDYYGTGLSGGTFGGDWATRLDGISKVNGSTPTTWDTIGENRYYYYSITAKYGASISNQWINQSNINSSTDFVSWFMMKTAKAYGGQGSGLDTVKGIIGIMDEQILGDLSSPTGNYVTARYTNRYNNWTYHIYFADADGNYPATENTSFAVRSSQSTASSQHAPSYEGYDNDESRTWKGSGFDMHYYYTPKQYSINFMDGEYVDGNGNTLQNKSGEPINQVDNIAYGADISSYNSYRLDPIAGYIFEGWYADKGCTSKYTFGTLPLGGLTVYAKWRQVQYRVFLHTGLTEIDDTNLNWGSTTVSLSFRVDYNKKVSAPTGKRDGYKFLGWYTSSGAAFSGSTLLNETTVTTSYDQTTPTDPATVDENGVQWYGPWDKGSGYNSDAENDRYWITKRFDLYAKWSKVLDGAEGIHVVYNADGYDTEGNAVTGDNAPNDDALYQNNTPVTAGPAATAPEGYVFDHWVVCTWSGNAYSYSNASQTALPGATFTINADDAKVTEIDTETKDYTVQLLAIYKEIEEKTPTHIPWYLNNGTRAFHVDILEPPTGDVSDSTLSINEAVGIQGAQTRTGYKFLGWARVEMGNTFDDVIAFESTSSNWTQSVSSLFLYYNSADGKFYSDSGFTKVAEYVAADQKTPYHAMFAVWRETLQIRITGNTDTRVYNGSEQSVTGYTVEYKLPDDEWTTTAPAGVAVTLVEGATAVAKGIHVDGGSNPDKTYPMGLTPASFVVNPGAYEYDQDTGLSIKQDGWLKITPVDLTIVMADRTLPYTGETQYGWSRTDTGKETVTGLVNNETVTIDYTPSSGKTVGTYTNGAYDTTTLVIKDGETNVTENYTLKSATAGKLIIEKDEKTLQVESADGEWPYDGDTHTNKTYTVTYGDEKIEGTEGQTEFTLSTGDKVTVTPTAKGTDGVKNVSDSGANSFTWTVENEGSYTKGEDTVGTLTITAVDLTIAMADRTLPYTGETQYGWSRTDTGKETVTGLVNNETVTIDYTPSSGKTVGTYTNGAYDTTTLVIKDGETNVTENYTLKSATAGKLIIEKDEKTLQVESADGEWPYDGDTHTNKTYTVTYGDEKIEGTEGQTEFTLSTGDKVTVTPTAKGTDGVKNVSDSGANSFTWTVENEGSYTKGEDTVGTLTITAVDLTIAMADRTLPYTGETQYGWSRTDAGKETVTGLVHNETVTITYTPSSGKTVGTYTNGAYDTTTLVIKDGETNVTENYALTSATAGKLIIEKDEKTLQVESADGEWPYDGDTHTNKTYTVTYGDEKIEGTEGQTEFTLSTGDKVTVTPTAKGADGVKNVSDSGANSFTWTVENEGSYTKGEDTVGTLTITAVDLTIAMADRTLPYTGETQYGWSRTDTGKETVTGLVNNETVTIDYTPSSGKTVGTYTNGAYDTTTLVIKDGETNVTENYTLKSATAGKLIIEKDEKTLQVESADGEWPYDGDTHTNKTYTVTYGDEKIEGTEGQTEFTLSTGDKVTVTPTAKGADGVKNVSDSGANSFTWTVENEGSYTKGEDTVGTLTITAVDLTIAMADRTLPYTGETQYGWSRTDTGKETVTGLVNNETVTIDYTPSSGKTVGTYTNGAYDTTTLVIKDGETNVTENYTLKSATAGKLIIEKDEKTLQVESADGEWPYDGDTHTNKTYTVTYGDEKIEGTEGQTEFTLSTGDKVTVTPTAKGTDGVKNVSDSGANSFTWTVENEGSYTKGEDTVGTLTITAVDLTIAMADRTLPYTGETQYGWSRTDTGKETVTGLVNNETVTIDYTPSSGKTVGTYTNGAYDTTTLVIKDGETNVTENYTLKSATAGKLIIEKDEKTLQVESADGEWPYDGDTHTNKTYTVTYGDEKIEGTEGQTEFTLSTGDKVTVTPTAKGTDGVKNVSDSGANSFTWTVENEGSYTKGEDTVGTLTITAVDLTIAMADRTLPYTGETQYGWSRTDAGKETVTGLVHNETVTITYTPSSGKTVGTYTNGAYDTTTLVIKDGETNVTENYALTSATAGKLIITASTKPLVITSSTKSWKYDGETHKDEVYTVTYDGMAAKADSTGKVFTLSTGDKVTITATAAGVKDYNASYSKNNTYTYVLENASNYSNVTENVGTLSITKRAVTLISATDKKVYDGTPLTNDKVTVGGDGFATGEGATYDVTGTITDVGEVPNAFTYTLNEGTKADNYTITKTEGTLTITPITDKVTVTITENSGTEKYDGTEKTVTGYEVTNISNKLYTEADFEFSGDDTVAGTDVGTYDMELKPEDFTNISKNFTNVEFVIVDGELEITKRTVTLTSATDSKVYDGTPLTNDEVTVGGDGFVTGEGATYNVTGTITDVGEVPNAFTYTLNEGTKAANYTITKKEGTLTVTPITDKVTVTITENSGTEKYDGTEKKATGYTVTSISNKLYTEADFEFFGDDTVTGTDAGTYDMELKPEDFTNISKNFTNVEFVIVDGKLEITKRTVTLTSATDKKVYDSTPLTNDTVTVSGDGFATGEGATCNVTGSQTLVGSSPNTFTYTLNSNTNADNYIITKVEGTLTVTDGTGENEEPVPDDLVVTKTVDDQVYKLGEEVTFDIVVINIYDETVTILLSEIDGVKLAQSTFENVAPGATITTTATYEIAEADILKGSFTNIVTATVKELSKTAEATAKTEDPNGHLTVTKITTSTPANGEAYALNEKITYKITVENDGNLTLTDMKVTDDLTGDEWTILSLAPGESKDYYPTEYTVTEADILAGTVVNVATAKGKSPDPDDPEPEDEDEDPEPTEDPEGHLTVTKETTSETPEGGYKLGETVSYKITVVNDGNLTITDIKVLDERTGDEWPVASLAPGESREFNASTTVTEGDILSGHIINEATATGKSPDPDKPDVPVTPDKTDDEPEDPEGHLTVTKETTSETPEGGYKLGETVSYKITVVNDGNLTITDIKVLDERTGDEWPVASLAPGESREFNASTTVTEGDILSGHIINEATATGKSPDPDKPDVPVTPDKTDDEPEDPEGHLTVTKETTSETPEGGYKLGETVSYKITVVNDGNLTITDIKVLDERTGDEWPVPSLAPGESREFTASTTVTEDDILSGHIINEATATGKSPDPDKPDVPVTPDETDDEPEDPEGHLTVTKETTSETPEGGYKLGETVSYKITVVNDGNLTITDIKVLDERTGDEWPVASLAPGESREFNASTTVTEGDILSGHIINEATATGKSPDPDKPDVPVTPDKTDDEPEDPNGHITIVKETTSTPEDAEGYAEGETITYKITATNDGNLTITDITVTDDLTGDKWPVESLKPGESKEFTAEYTVTAKDAAAGEVLNVATATGKSPDPEKPDVPVTPGEDPEPTVETKFTLIIRYWIGSTEGELINTVIRVEKAGTEYDVVTPPMEGYTADIAEIKGVLEKDTEYDVVYTPEDYTLTILYRFQDGTEAAETYTEVLHFGDEYSVESPVIQTYFANKQKVEGVMPARDVTVTVIYAKYPVIITIDDFETPLGIGLGSINVGETIE